MSEPIADDDRYIALEVVVRKSDRVTIDTLMGAIENLLGACDPAGCTCGLELMGGTEGTLTQCYRYLDPDAEYD